MAIYKNTPPIVTNSLVLYVDAGNTMSYKSGSAIWSDLGSNKITGSLINSPTFNRDYQGSIGFNGINQYINLGTQSTLQFTNAQAFSISSWVYWTSTSIFDGSCVMSYQAGSGQGYYLLLDPSIISPNLGAFFDYTDSSNLKGIQTIVNLPIRNVWINIAVTVSATVNSSAGLTMYLNGRRLQTTPRAGSGTPSSVNYSGASANIGAINNGVSPIEGKIAQVMMYNRELSAREIAQNYNALKSRFGLI